MMSEEMTLLLIVGSLLFVLLGQLMKIRELECEIQDKMEDQALGCAPGELVPSVDELVEDDGKGTKWKSDYSTGDNK